MVIFSTTLILRSVKVVNQCSIFGRLGSWNSLMEGLSFVFDHLQDKYCDEIVEQYISTVTNAPCPNSEHNLVDLVKRLSY